MNLWVELLLDYNVCWYELSGNVWLLFDILVDVNLYVKSGFSLL